MCQALWAYGIVLLTNGSIHFVLFILLCLSLENPFPSFSHPYFILVFLVLTGLLACLQSETPGY